MIILKVTKNRSFTLSLEDTILEKQRGVKLIPPPDFLELNLASKVGYFLYLFTHGKYIVCFASI